MEKHRCGICSKCFSNGKALGGHMRTHLAFLPIPLKSRNSIKLGASSFLHSTRKQENTSLNYGSKKNPDKSPKQFTQRRPRRNWKMVSALFNFLDEKNSTDLVSITSPVEVVAFAVLMLKRTCHEVEEETGKEKVEENKKEASEDENGGYKEDDNDDNDDDGDDDIYNNDDDDYELQYLTQSQARAQAEGTHRYETRKKAFRSHQELEFHKEKHEEIKVQIQETNEVDFGVDTKNIGKTVYKCPSCSKVFKSGQALGGHKKIHGSSSRNAMNSDKFGGRLMIDLNLPPPEEVSETTMWLN